MVNTNSYNFMKHFKAPEIGLLPVHPANAPLRVDGGHVRRPDVPRQGRLERVRLHPFVRVEELHRYQSCTFLLLFRW